MKNRIEKRRDPRIPVGWPVVVMIPQGAIKGKTANISVNGLALLLFPEIPQIDDLLFPEMPEIDDELQITLSSPEDNEIPVTCEKIWSGNINFDGSVYTGIGVRFTKISSSDRQIIASKVAEYYPI